MPSAPQPWRVVVVALAAAVASCSDTREANIRFEPVEQAFQFPDGEPPGREPLDALCADMDLDGDDDLLVNWHHLAPLELFENHDGVFVPLGHSAGLVDNEGLPELFGDSNTIYERITSNGTPGLYLWHGLPRDTDGWRLTWNGGSARRLEVVSNNHVTEVVGLAVDEFTILPDRQTLQITLPADERVFGIKTDKATGQLTLTLGPGPEPIFVGPQLEPIDGRSLTVWKPDPHGIAWGDVGSDPRPELYVTRGAMMGTLLPPAGPKRDRYFVPQDGPELYASRTHLVPPDFGRGRSVEWVDVDLDGHAELSIGNNHSPNRLLDRPSFESAFADRAPELGLDLAEGQVHTWGDHDDDGRDDLFFVDGNTLRLLRNAPEGFALVPGVALPLKPSPQERVISVSALALADFDNDGRLDLWLTGHGARQTHQLFLRRDDGYEEVTEQVGLDAVGGDTVVLLADWDNDSFLDAVSFGPPPEPDSSSDPATPGAALPLARLWHNRGGQRFEIVPLDLSATNVLEDEIRAAVATDVDQDGRLDIVAIGDKRHLLRNVTPAGAGVTVIFPTGASSLGALVRGEYADGTLSARRYGSASNSAYGQSLRPLTFASPDRNPLRRILVRWPGTTTDVAHDAPSAGQPLRLERP